MTCPVGHHSSAIDGGDKAGAGGSLIRKIKVLKKWKE